MNRAEYEWLQHCDLAIEAGIPASTMQEVHASKLDKLDTKHRLAVDIDPGEELTDKIRSEFNDKAVVELVATIAGYNMVSRFLVALGVGQ